MRRRRALRQELARLKYDVAQEIGLTNTPSGEEGYREALRRRKEEAADELGISDRVREVGWPQMTARECGRVGGRTGGRIGGQMVRRMIEYAEKGLGQHEGR
ncbi:MAG: small, acid-soluble spore protein, alpha/beta type [Thermaerobacter sp.]|nr:small, acid-soluble spore protein, alpha/beta type [Thermaerobacter sp.]